MSMVDLSGDTRIRIRPGSMVGKVLRKVTSGHVPVRGKHVSTVRRKDGKNISVVRPKTANVSIVRRKRPALMGCMAQSGRACIHAGQCHISGDCLGIDGYSAEELRRLYYSANNPELMGGKIKESLQRAKKKVQKAVKKMPKPLKALAKVAAAPVMLPALLNKKVRKKVGKDVKKVVKKMPKPLKTMAKIAAAPLLLPALASKKVRKKVGKDVGKAIKKMPKPLRIAAGIALAPLAVGLLPAAAAMAPAVLPKIAAAKAAKKIAENRKKRTNIAEVRRKQVEKKTGETVETPLPVSQVAPGAQQPMEETGPVSNQQAPGEQEETTTEAEPEKKKGSAVLPLLGLAALLPFLL